MINFIYKNTVIRWLVVWSLIIFGLPQYKSFATDASILPQGVTQFLDDDGNPLSTGKVYFYIPSTLTFKTTWQNAAKSITNTNPVDLDASGRAIIYGDGSYRQIVKDSLGNTIYDAVTTAPLTGSSATLVGDGNLVSTVLPWSGLVAPAQYVFGYGQQIARATYPDFYTAITSSQTASCTSASPTITGLSDTTQIIVGTAVEVSCMAAGTTVVSKTLTTATLSNNATASTTATAVFFPWGNGDGSTTFNVPDLRGYNLAGRDNMGGTAALRLANGNGIGRPLGIANFNYLSTKPANTTEQRLISGTAATYTPTSASVSYAYIEMCAAGGGGGAQATNAGAAGSADASFQVNATGTAWTAVKGSGGPAGGASSTGGAGGTGGTDGSTGTLALRLTGSRGGVSTAGTTGAPGAALGGAAPKIGLLTPAQISAQTGLTAPTNSCGGGSGGGTAATGWGGGGGGGEYVAFWAFGITSATYTVGTGGAGGAAGTIAGGVGAAGLIVVTEYYDPTSTSTSFTAITSGTLEQQRTINYVVKVTADTSASAATGVASLGGMTGVITCGTGLTCTSNTITATPQFNSLTLIGYATNVNLNSANTDTAIPINLPSGITNYRIQGVLLQNIGTTASLTTATGGLFSAAAGGGLALAANQAVSAITSNAVNTDANLFSLTSTIGVRTVINSAILYFRVGTAQGAAATGNVYLYGYLMPN